MFRVVLPALIALIALTGAAQAASKAKLVELRVEGDGTTLEEGAWYATGSQPVKRGRTPSCEARNGSDRFTGATALTVLAGAADFNRDLRPVRTRPTDFGPQVCQVGGLRSFGTFPDPNAGFLYWVNYVSGFSSPDLADVDNGDSALWYYAVFPSDPPQPDDPPTANTGLPLELEGVPAHDADGEFTARVVVHDFDGTPTPVTDATIMGADAASHAAGGEYEIRVGAGTTELFAARGADIRSNRLEVCVDQASDCPKAHGRTIVGSKRGDELKGTRGFDDISAGGGGDEIDLRKGGRDRADCGAGKDLVLLKRGDGDDRVGGDCERIRRS